MKVYRNYPNIKCCATCEFWGAIKRIYNNRVESEEWGICLIGEAVIYKKEKKYRDHCSRYLRWIALDIK